MEAMKARLARKLAQDVRAAEGDVRQIGAEAAAKGALRSGGHMLKLVECVRQHLQEATLQAILEVRQQPGGQLAWEDYFSPDLRAALFSHLEALADVSQVRDAERFGGTPAAAVKIKELLAEIGGWLEGELSDFENGVWSPRLVPGGTPVASAAAVTNITTVHGAVGGSIMQAGSGAVQVAGNLDVGAALAALGALEQALRSSSLPAEDRDDGLAEIETLRAQLRKRQPARAVLEHGARALYGLSLGVAGNLLTPQAEALLKALHLHT